MRKLSLPLSEEVICGLNVGDAVLLSGVIYTARDCAHKKLFELLDENKPLPIDLDGATFYYAGPCPAKEGMASGSCGPTTSARMEYFAPRLIDLGLKCIIGKGEMSDEVSNALKRNNACYFAAVGGAGALYGSKIEKCELIAFPELLSEAIFRLEIKDFPVIVAADSEGGSIYKR